MPFPFLAPINRKEWLVKVLEERERNPQSLAIKMPYAVLASGALVVKDTPTVTSKNRRDKLKELIKNPKNGYTGCIITNNIKLSDTYQLEETIVGYDFSGKPIKVEGEKNRRVSTPIIEEIEINTDGANNTLKTATISIKCFTLKQLEMFELFFLKAGMPLMLEFGDSSLLRESNKTSTFSKYNPYSKPEEALIINNISYDQFIKTFSEVTIPNDKTFENFYKRAERSLGTYDYVAGKVTNFSYSIDDNSVYNISLEISQGNQFTLAIPSNAYKLETIAGTSAKNVKTSDVAVQALLQLGSEFNLDISKFNALISKKDYKREFFNVGKRNEKIEDSTISLKPYISLRFILDVLLNYSSNEKPEFVFNIPKYNVSGTIKEIIPVRSHKKIISSSELIIFPGNLPNIDYKDSKSNEIIFLETSIDGKINNYSFNLEPNSVIQINGADKKLKDDYVYGDALNCFILYDEVKEIWNKSYTRIDFLEQILNIINKNNYGIFELHIGASIEGGKNSIIDYKLSNTIDNPKESVYRFKPTTINSIVRSFTFNMELSDLIAGHTVFNAQTFIRNALQNSKENALSVFEENYYKSADMSQYATYDGWYSIDNISVKTLQTFSSTIEQSISGSTQNNIKQNEDKTVTKEKQNERASLLTSKFINFKDNKDSAIRKLIFIDSETVKSNIVKNTKQENIIKSTLTPIDITIIIDGISGLTCGEYFHIDGIPETYNRDGVFQITNIKHNLTAEGWLTSIEAGWRIIN